MLLLAMAAASVDPCDANPQTSATISSCAKAAAAASRPVNGSCDKYVQTVEVSNCAWQLYKENDRAMNAQYRSAIARFTVVDEGLRQSHYNGTLSREYLKAAQIAWLKYRDNTCEGLALISFGGTITSSNHAFCLADVTKKRTEELRKLTSFPESPH